MKFSIRLNNDLPVGDYVTMAKVAESAGFDQIWISNDLFLHSASVLLTTVAVATERIEIGTCILNPYTMNPSEIAMLAATLDVVSGQRFNLGISSGAADFLEWIGIAQKLPRTAVIDSIHVINALLSGERAKYDGDFLQWTDDAYLRFQPERRVPIYIGAMSPKMLGEIGRIADGGLPLLFPPEHYVNVLPHIRNGAEVAERSIDDIDIAACVWCSISDDRAAAEWVLKEKIAYYGHAMSPMILSQLGLTHDDFKEIEAAVMKENDIEKAASLVTPQMLRIGITGTAHDLIERMEALADLGVKHLSFGPPLGPDPIKAVEVIGREVIPYFARKA